MNVNEKQQMPSFSKTQSNFNPRLSQSKQNIYRQKAASSKYSAYTTSKKKLSQIHSDLAQLECKFNNFHNNLNMLINCDNSSADFSSHYNQNLLPPTLVKECARQNGKSQKENQDDNLFNFQKLGQNAIYQLEKQQQLPFIPQNQPKPFILSSQKYEGIENIFSQDNHRDNIPLKKVSFNKKQRKRNQSKTRQKNNVSTLKDKKQGSSSKKVNKTYAMRNFPIQYFDNVQLLFQIMNRKKNRLKYMNSQSKNKYNKQRKTFNHDKQNIIDKKNLNRLYSEQNQANINHGQLSGNNQLIFINNQQKNPNNQHHKLNINQFYLNNNDQFSYNQFKSDRKLSKDTVSKRPQQQKIISVNSKRQLKGKYFIPLNMIQQKMESKLDHNNQVQQGIIDNNFQSDCQTNNFDNFVAMNNVFNQNRFKKHSKKVTNKTQRNFNIRPNHIHKNASQQNISNLNKFQYCSPTKSDFHLKNVKNINNQYISRNLITKTADQNTKRRKYVQSNENLQIMNQLNPFASSASNAFLKLGNRQQQQLNINTADLDKTGIFQEQFLRNKINIRLSKSSNNLRKSHSPNQYQHSISPQKNNHSVSQNQKHNSKSPRKKDPTPSPTERKRYEYSQQQSFLKKINDNHNKKSNYCYCCINRKYNLETAQSNLNHNRNAKNNISDLKSVSNHKKQQNNQCDKCHNQLIQIKLSQPLQDIRQQNKQIIRKQYTEKQFKRQKTSHENYLTTKQNKFKTHKLNKAKSTANMLGLMKDQQKAEVQNNIKVKQSNDKLKNQRNQKSSQINVKIKAYALLTKKQTKQKSEKSEHKAKNSQSKTNTQKVNLNTTKKSQDNKISQKVNIEYKKNQDLFQNVNLYSQNFKDRNSNNNKLQKTKQIKGSSQSNPTKNNASIKKSDFLNNTTPDKNMSVEEKQNLNKITHKPSVNEKKLSISSNQKQKSDIKSAEKPKHINLKTMHGQQNIEGQYSQKLDSQKSPNLQDRQQIIKKIETVDQINRIDGNNKEIAQKLLNRQNDSQRSTFNPSSYHKKEMNKMNTNKTQKPKIQKQQYNKIKQVDSDNNKAKQIELKESPTHFNRQKLLNNTIDMVSQKNIQPSWEYKQLCQENKQSFQENKYPINQVQYQQNEPEYIYYQQCLKLETDLQQVNNEQPHGNKVMQFIDEKNNSAQNSQQNNQYSQNIFENQQNLQQQQQQTLQHYSQINGQFNFLNQQQQVESQRQSQENQEYRYQTCSQFDKEIQKQSVDKKLPVDQGLQEATEINNNFTGNNKTIQQYIRQNAQVEQNIFKISEAQGQSEKCQTNNKNQIFNKKQSQRQIKSLSSRKGQLQLYNQGNIANAKKIGAHGKENTIDELQIKKQNKQINKLSIKEQNAKNPIKSTSNNKEPITQIKSNKPFKSSDKSPDKPFKSDKQNQVIIPKVQDQNNLALSQTISSNTIIMDNNQNKQNQEQNQDNPNYLQQYQNQDNNQIINLQKMLEIQDMTKTRKWFQVNNKQNSNQVALKSIENEELKKGNYQLNKHTGSVKAIENSSNQKNEYKSKQSLFSQIDQQLNYESKQVVILDLQVNQQNQLVEQQRLNQHNNELIKGLYNIQITGNQLQGQGESILNLQEQQKNKIQSQLKVIYDKDALRNHNNHSIGLENLNKQQKNDIQDYIKEVDSQTIKKAQTVQHVNQPTSDNIISLTNMLNSKKTIEKHQYKEQQITRSIIKLQKSPQNQEQIKLYETDQQQISIQMQQNNQRQKNNQSQQKKQSQQKQNKSNSNKTLRQPDNKKLQQQDEKVQVKIIQTESFSVEGQQLQSSFIKQDQQKSSIIQCYDKQIYEQQLFSQQEEQKIQKKDIIMNKENYDKNKTYKNQKNVHNNEINSQKNNQTVQNTSQNVKYAEIKQHKKDTLMIDKKNQIQQILNVQQKFDHSQEKTQIKQKQQDINVRQIDDQTKHKSQASLTNQLVKSNHLDNKLENQSNDSPQNRCQQKMECRQQTKHQAQNNTANNSSDQSISDANKCQVSLYLNQLFKNISPEPIKQMFSLSQKGQNKSENNFIPNNTQTIATNQQKDDLLLTKNVIEKINTNQNEKTYQSIQKQSIQTPFQKQSLNKNFQTKKQYKNQLSLNKALNKVNIKLVNLQQHSFGQQNNIQENQIIQVNKNVLSYQNQVFHYQQQRQLDSIQNSKIIYQSQQQNFKLYSSNKYEDKNDKGKIYVKKMRNPFNDHQIQDTNDKNSKKVKNISSNINCTSQTQTQSQNFKSTHQENHNQGFMNCTVCAQQAHYKDKHGHFNPYMNPCVSLFNPYSQINPFYNPFFNPQNMHNFDNNFQSRQKQTYQDEQSQGQNRRKVSKNRQKSKKHKKLKRRVSSTDFDNFQQHQLQSIIDFDLKQSELKITHNRFAPNKGHKQKAQIVNFIKNYQLKPIRIRMDSQIERLKDCEEQFLMTVKLLRFIDPQHKFIKRIFQFNQNESANRTQDNNNVKLWLFPNQLQFRQQSSFQQFQITNTRSHNLKNVKQMTEYIKLTVEKLQSQFKYTESNITKQIIQMITGATLFNIKSSSFNKLKNLHKHENIKGFTFSAFKKQLYQIIGSQQIQGQNKEETKKIVHLRKCQNSNDKFDNSILMTQQRTNNQVGIINVKWQDFMKKFTNSLIGVFCTKYQIRALHFINQKFVSKQKRNFVFSMKLGSPQHKSKNKQHCIINVNMFGNSLLGDTFNQTKRNEESNNKGRILVYYQRQADSNKFKYVGSGDLTFISMRIKQGKYLVILQFSQKTLLSMQEGKVIINYGGKQIQLSEQKWTNDYSSMMVTQNTQFIKTNRA